MARRVRPFAYLALLVGVLVLPARAQNDKAGPVPAEAIKVKVEKIDGTEFTGTLADPTLTLAADFGRAVVDLNKVKTVDVAVHDTITDVTITLLDGEMLHGTATAESGVRVTRDDGSIDTLTLTAIRELTILRKPDLSLVAIVSGLVMLTLLEIILGVDNVIFLAILVAKLPQEQQKKARWIGLGAALGTRMALLFSLTWMLGLTKAVITLPFPFLAPDARDLSWRDIILLAGGLFLIVKSVSEMREKLAAVTHADTGKAPVKVVTSFAKTILWIALIDIVFSLDSVITAVGTVDASLVWVMVTAMVIAMLVMLLFAKPIGDFVEHRPTVKILALAFLILIGVLLVAEGFGQHINKGYIYFAMAFAVLVEFVNLKLRPTKTDME